jgi:hypothetical protein
MDVGISDFVVQQAPNGPCGFRADRLGLIADVQLRDFFVAVVRVHLASKHFDECSFASSVLPEENDNFGVSELTTLDFHSEVTQGLKRQIDRVEKKKALTNILFSTN